MPARYIIDKARRLVISLGWDPLTFSDFREQQESFIRDPDFDPAFNQLVDVTRVTSLSLSTEEAKLISGRSIFLPTSRRAVVASTPAVFGMGRMMDAYHTIATGRENVAVFYDREEAMRWLGLEPFEIEPGM